jgi:hypothetical protein
MKYRMIHSRKCLSFFRSADASTPEAQHGRYRMNKMLRRKKHPVPYQPKKRRPSRRRTKRVWSGEASAADLYYAETDPRQLHFFFYPANVERMK